MERTLRLLLPHGTLHAPESMHNGQHGTGRSPSFVRFSKSVRLVVA